MPRTCNAAVPDDQGPGGYRLYGDKQLDALDSEDHEVRVGVFEALARLLANPFACTDPPTYPLKGSAAEGRAGWRVAELPGGWTLTYSVHPEGLPPLGAPLVAIRALLRTK